MKVDRVLVKVVLKLGNGTMIMPGTIFPNPEFPEIPREIRLELNRNRGTVEVLQLSTTPATANAQTTPEGSETAPEASQLAGGETGDTTVERTPKTANEDVPEGADQAGETTEQPPATGEQEQPPATEEQPAAPGAPELVEEGGGTKRRKPITTK